MKITCISDLHGYYPGLSGGDLLIIAGDLTARDTQEEYLYFSQWLADQAYSKKTIIAGNHDNRLVKTDDYVQAILLGDSDYLCDSGTEFKGLKIWGSPWTISFQGMNPNCKAFTLDTEEELAEKWALIPEGIDILITHSPPHGILDSFEVLIESKWGNSMNHLGSEELDERIQIVKPELHVFGHIHGAYGVDQVGSIICVNASHVNERYEPVNAPITIEI